MPLVSVIITTHNRVHLLPIAINSVLWQTFKDFELIVVDDVSSDDTPEIIKDYENKGYLQGLRIENSEGANHARNQGIKMAKGEYVAFLDDDDWWFPNKLERQVQIFNTNKDVVIVGCWFLLRNQVKRLPEQISYRRFLSINAIGGFSMCIFRRRDVLAVGGLDENLQNSQDWDLWLSLIERGKVIIIPECLVYYNTNNVNRITKYEDRASYYANYLAVVKRHEHKMSFWTKQRHYSLVGYHTTPKFKKPFKIYWVSYYFFARMIDDILIKANILWYNTKSDKNT